MSPDVWLAASDKAAHADTYVGIGAGICSILAFVGIPTWRAFRTARKERAHQTGLIADIHGAIYGTPEKHENGVKVDDAKKGLRDEVADLKKQLDEGSAPMKELAATLERNHRENSRRLDRHEERLARVEFVAGEAATTASAAKDRLEFLSGRWWERVESVEIRNRMLTSTLEQHGFEVGPEPDGEHEDGDESSDLHDP